MNKKGIFPYRGVTRISKMEHIPEKSMSYKSKIQGVYFPEGMFIFALPKGGTTNCVHFNRGILTVGLI
jgi:hypothetical protein